MKKLIWLSMLGLLGLAVPSFAGEGCCAAKKAEKPALCKCCKCEKCTCENCTCCKCEKCTCEKKG